MRTQLRRVLAACSSALPGAKGVRYPSQGLEVVSFDVFDTVLIRAVGSPHAVFQLLGRQQRCHGIFAYSPEAFARARLAADRRAFSNAGGRDSTVGLDDIYREVLGPQRHRAALRDELVDAELALEAGLLRVHPHAPQLLEAWRSTGTRVIFISDTYLSQDYLEDRLCEHGLLHPGERCYVSSHEAAAKSTGALFTRVLKQEKITAAQLIHHGNDLQADVRAAAKHGIATRFLPSGNLGRYERILESHRWATDGLSSSMAGAARLTRLTIPAASSREAAIRDAAAGVAAPTLVAYVLWLLMRARELGTERLYFLARDGQVLHRLALRLAPSLGVECELHYLHVSRRSVNLAAAGSLDERTQHLVMSHAAGACPRRLLDRIELTPEDVGTALGEIGLPHATWDRPMSDRELKRFLALLRDDPRCQGLIRSRGQAAHALVARYLHEQGFLAPGRVGLVDLGGIGTQLHALAQLREVAGTSQPQGFLAYRESSPDRDPERTGPPIEAFLTDAVTGHGVRRFPGMVAFLETFATADHGTVRGYVEQGGRVLPRLADADRQALTSWGWELVEHSVTAFVDHLLLDETLIDPGADTRECVAEVLRALVLEPSPSEAAAWGSFPFGTGGGEPSVELAPAWSLEDVARRLRGQPLPGDWYGWREASLRRSPALVRSALRAGDVGRRGLRRGQMMAGRAATRW